MLRSVIVMTAAVLALTAATPSEAAKKLEGTGIGACWIDGTSHPAGPGEAISSCCYEDGCWICSATWDDCTWDPAYRAGGSRQVLPFSSGQVLDRGTPDPGSRGGARPRQVAPWAQQLYKAPAN